MSGHHARIAPSSLALTVACQAWVQLADGLPPEPDTPETLEGNAADWVAKQYAQGNEVAYGSPTPVPGLSVDYDMIHGARLWAKVLGYGSVTNVPVIIERIHPTECWGEPDGWKYDPIDRVLHMPDYKYGFGVVDVFENWQLIAYAVGLMDTLGLKDFETLIKFTIVQPRAPHASGPVRTWAVRGDNIRALVNKAWAAAVRALPPDYAKGVSEPPEATVGPHCLHCPARLVCETYQKSCTKVVEFVGRSQAVALPPEAAGTELLILELAYEVLEGRISALRTQVDAYLRAGKSVPNYFLEPRETRLEWLPDVTEAEALGLGSSLPKPVNLLKPPAALNSRNSRVVTPTQAIKAGVDATVMSNYASRLSGAMKLARISTTEARRAFGATE
jgi:hypothetical protein